MMPDLKQARIIDETKPPPLKKLLCRHQGDKSNLASIRGGTCPPGPDIGLKN